MREEKRRREEKYRVSERREEEYRVSERREEEKRREVQG